MSPLLAILVAALLALHMASIVLALWRVRVGDQPALKDLPPVSIMRPVCGFEYRIEEALGSTFVLDHPRYEIIFCIASPTDEALPLVERLMRSHSVVPARLLIGDDRISGNPKLNNLVKGWKAARHDWIVMVDSNVLLPADYLSRLFSRWRFDTGLVSSPAIGIEPKGFSSELECAFLNTYQARWQLAADQLGLGFAQGKNMLFRRDILERAGGIEALASEVAEDVASTKIVHLAGLRVGLVAKPFPQPLGFRSFADVWWRQVRWARLRRAGFAALFVPELLAGGFFPIVASVILAAANGWSLGWVAGLALVWYGLEAMLAGAAQWPRSAVAVLAAIIRDLLLPALWVFGWTGNRFVWRGTPMTIDKPSAAS
jgi:ceramide glucosyltransferase